MLYHATSWNIMLHPVTSCDAASLQEQGCSELKLQATEVEVSGVKPRPELPPITLLLHSW